MISRNNGDLGRLHDTRTLQRPSSRHDGGQQRPHAAATPSRPRGAPLPPSSQSRRNALQLASPTASRPSRWQFHLSSSPPSIPVASCNSPESRRSPNSAVNPHRRRSSIRPQPHPPRSSHPPPNVQRGQCRGCSSPSTTGTDRATHPASSRPSRSSAARHREVPSRYHE